LAYFAFIFSSIFCGDAVVVLVTPYGNVSFAHPAFISFESIFSTNDLLITQFSETGSGSVYAVTDAQELFTRNANLKSVFNASTLGNDYTWPNVAAPIPKEVFNSDEKTAYCKGGGDNSDEADTCGLLVVPDGFLTPGHKTGGVYLLAARTTSITGKVALSPSEKNWFYHHVNWVDLDGDGRLDVLAARANIDTFGRSRGELIWLRHPAVVDMYNPWEMLKLTDGPDVITLVVRGNNDLLYVFAAEFFGEKLSLTTLKPGAGTIFVSYEVLDATVGPTEDLHLADVDGDGVAELVISSHEGDSGGSVYAYELPPNLDPKAEGADKTSMNASWERILLGTGFQVTKPGPNQASPGFIYPVMSDTDKRPVWFIAGDGSQGVHVMFPVQDDSGSNMYKYDVSKILDVGGTVGTLAINDLDGDGVLEMAVPDYDNSLILFYKVQY
jgi:hypothetical protein